MRVAVVDSLSCGSLWYWFRLWFGLSALLVTPVVDRTTCLFSRRHCIIFYLTSIWKEEGKDPVLVPPADDFLCLHNTKVGDVITPAGLWSTSGPFSRGYSHQDLPRQSFVGIFVTWSNHSCWDLSIWRSGSRLRFYEFHSCSLCHAASHHELISKISSLPLILEIALFQSLLKILGRR